MACESLLIMVILPADSYSCQLYSTRICGCTQRELPGTTVREMASSFWSTAQTDITWEGCSYGQKGGTGHLRCSWKNCSLPGPGAIVSSKKEMLFFGSRFVLPLEHQHLSLHPWDVPLLGSELRVPGEPGPLAGLRW
ncbi:uncharacterized protein LOC143164735 [Aptenodytes patagonicus]|uniref:uncharacterized protein LOC143164735 n=1 Tax=Aptenodytes patagonicus TaxID=9234 RepID=UPI003F9F3081